MIIGIDAKVLTRTKTGIGKYLLEILQYLNANDKENTYILYANKPLELDFALSERFSVRIYKARIGSLGVRYKLPKLLKADKVDVFWGPDHFIPKKGGYKRVLTVHDLALFRFKRVSSRFNTLLMKLYLKRMCKEADRIIAISNATKDDLQSLFKIPESKITVVYNGAKPYAYEWEIGEAEQAKIAQAVREKYGVTGEYFLFVGTLEPRKNILNIVKAFNAFKQRGYAHKLVLVGDMGWRSENLKELLNTVECKADILLTGFVDKEEKEYLYRNARLFVFPSLYEGFGLPIIEAMSVGTLVLTSNVSAMPEVGGDSAFYVQDPYDAQEIYSAMVEIVEGGAFAERKAMGVEIAGSFTRERCGEQTKACITVW